MSEFVAYFEGFQNSVRAAAAADGTFTARAFVDEVAKRLSLAEEIDTLIPSHFEGTVGRRKLQVDAYDFGDEENQIVLAISDFRSSDHVETLSMSDARRQIGFLENFLAACVDGSLVGSLEESSEAFQVATDIRRLAQSTFKVRLYLLTNAKVTGSTKASDRSNIGGVEVEHHIWDIERFERVEASQLGREEIDIDLTEWKPGGVPALFSSSGETDLQTYLAVLPGELLAGIYARYGGRVLEANVRSFLTARVAVNKGIKGTVQQEPSMFLAYNNGVAATASGVTTELRGGAVFLTSIRDLQIVNGGQTTASLFYTQRNDKADLSKIAVQMKLIVVADNQASDLVPKISRYANTQNRVSEADFFSNHPFHVRMEEISRRLLAPVSPGLHFQTKWFYERTRGQFLNEKARLSVPQARRFDNEYPRSQVLTKTDAAKYLVSWGQRPHIVSSGAQKNFIAFANQVSEAWTKNDEQFGEAYFRKLVCLGILFNTLRARVQRSSWYSTGYLANIVAYALALTSRSLDGVARGSELDFSAIWKAQSVPEDLLVELERIAKVAFDVLTDDERPVLNVTEWAKREKCWDTAVSRLGSPTDTLRRYCVAPSDALEQRQDDHKLQRLDSGIGAQVIVMKLGSRYWVNLRAFGNEMKGLTERDLSIIKTATGESGKLPSDLQAKHLIELDRKMKLLGFVGN